MAVGTLLVIGARKKSLGRMVASLWSDMYDSPAVTAGISGDEKEYLNLSDFKEIKDLLKAYQPDRVVVTVGVNNFRLPREDFEDWMLEHLRVNVVLPMRVWEAWSEVGFPKGAHFVAISSNSAHIPRSGSMAYCASKAALSMAIRVAARDMGKRGAPMIVYGYEPGLIKGTPMTEGLEFAGPATRMLGLPDGLSKRAVATQIVMNLAYGGPELNGTLYRLDAGEI